MLFDRPSFIIFVLYFALHCLCH